MSVEPQYFDKMSKGVKLYISIPCPLTRIPAGIHLAAFAFSWWHSARFFDPSFVTLRSLQVP